MRKLTYIAALLVALVATGYAVADGIEGAKSASAVAGTFTATGASTSSRTCTTTDDKTIVVTDGKYTGTATGDPDLTGPITLRARSVINTTDNVGVVSGSLRIDQTPGGNTSANYSAVYDHGTIAGLATGRAHGPSAGLVANLSATSRPRRASRRQARRRHLGRLGGRAGTAARASRRSPTPEKSEAHGTISALSATSITVAGLTCAIPSDKSAAVNAKFKQNDVAQIRCSLVSGVNTLTTSAARRTTTDAQRRRAPCRAPSARLPV